MSSKYDKTRKALDELMDALRERHAVLADSLRCSQERHESGSQHLHQALVTTKYWIALGSRVEEALDDTRGEGTR